MTEEAIPKTASRPWYWRVRPMADAAFQTMPGRTMLLKPEASSLAITQDSLLLVERSMVSGRKSRPTRPNQRRVRTTRRAEDRARSSKLGWPIFQTDSKPAAGNECWCGYQLSKGMPGSANASACSFRRAKDILLLLQSTGDTSGAVLLRRAR